MDIKLPSDFKDFLRLLNAHEVRFLLIGGYAVGYHGYPRATNDMDVWIAIDLVNAARVVAALHDFGFNAPELRPELFLDERQIVRMGVKPVRIGIMTSISGLHFDECYAARTIDSFDGVDVPIIGLEHLKMNKQASGRTKDLADLEHLP